MNTNASLTIAFKGLNDGFHEFEYSLGNSFFENIEYSEFEKGEIKVNVHLHKKPHYLQFEIEIEGEVEVLCDRCLEMYFEPFWFEGTLYAKKSGEQDAGDDNEIMILSHDAYEVDITHFVYESICLSLPYQRIHPENERGKSTCNKDMLKQIKKHTSQVHEDQTDPRWDTLKNLK